MMSRATLSVRNLSVAALLACVSVGSALAVDVVRPDGARIHQDDWLFVPVVTITDGTSVDVLGALALRDPSLTVGDNIVAVWYENPHAANTKWPAVTWTSQNQWDAVKWVKAQYSIDSTWDFVWPCDRDPFDDASPPVAVGYDKGLLEGDPLADIGDPETHDDIVKILVDAGYTAASVTIDKDGPCGSATVLPALEDIVTLNVLFNPTEGEVQDALGTMLSPGCATGSLASWHAAPPPGTWTPRPFVPGLPASNPRSLPGWPTVPVCAANPPPATGCTCRYLTTLTCTAFCAPPPGAILEEWSCLCPAAACPVTTVNPGPTDPATAGCFTCAPTPRYWY